MKFKSMQQPAPKKGAGWFRCKLVQKKNDQVLVLSASSLETALLTLATP